MPVMLQVICLGKVTESEMMLRTLRKR